MCDQWPVVYTQCPVHFHLSALKSENSLSENAILREVRFVYIGGRIFTEKVPVTVW